ncbi:hypothetical protein [Alkalibaculum sporogenes]|nr:hypothetical protein [Alkalibaculum sporogenes]
MKLKRLVLTILVIIITVCTIKFQIDIVNGNQAMINEKDIRVNLLQN